MMHTVAVLFFEFFKTGLFAVGGGLATIPFLNDMELRFPEWFSGASVADIVAIAESTPGPIGVNAATFAGYSAAGVFGAITATLALILPSLIVITVISGFLKRYRESKLVNDAFSGMRPMVAGLIAASAWSMILVAVFRGSGSLLGRVDWVCAALFAVFVALMQVKKLKKLHPACYIGFGALLGLILGL